MNRETFKKWNGDLFYGNEDQSTQDCFEYLLKQTNKCEKSLS